MPHKPLCPFLPGESVEGWRIRRRELAEACERMAEEIEALQRSGSKSPTQLAPITRLSDTGSSDSDRRVDVHSPGDRRPATISQPT